jgi:hypothetical protein
MPVNNDAMEIYSDTEMKKNQQAGEDR